MRRFSCPILFKIAAMVLTVCSFVNPVFFVLNFLTRSVVVIGLWERYRLIEASFIASGSFDADDDVSFFAFLLWSFASLSLFDFPVGSEICRFVF